MNKERVISEEAEPKITDFEVLFYKGRNNNIVSVPNNPRNFGDLIEIQRDCTLEAYDLSNHFREGENEKNVYTALSTNVGPTSGSKTTFWRCVFNDQANLISGLSHLMPMIVSDYERRRAQAFESGELEGLESIDQPFENKHIETVSGKHEPLFAEDIKKGGRVIGTKPSGPYGAVWPKVEGVAGFNVSVRPFGPDTMKKLRRLEPPFNEINPDRVIWDIDAAVLPSLFVNQVAGAYRNVLQIAESNNDLVLAHEAQIAFKRKRSRNLGELKMAREGGSMKGIFRTNEGIKEVVNNFYRRGILHGRLDRNSLVLIDLELRHETDKEILTAASKDILDLAQEVASFFSAEPTDKMLRYLVSLEAYIRAQVVVQLATDLEAGDFYQKHPLEPIVSVVLRSNPSMKIYSEEDRKRIRKLFEDYGLGY